MKQNGGAGEEPSGETAIKVAVRLRPQSEKEKAEQVGVCATVVPGLQQVTIKNKTFTFDRVFDKCASQEDIFSAYVKQLVDGAFDGYNATVLAYGQTGSGKTYTMGTAFDASAATLCASTGIVPRAAHRLWDGIKQRTESAQSEGKAGPAFKMHVQFIELYNEEVRDLLAVQPRGAGPPLKIHEDPFKRDGIQVKGATNLDVTSPAGIIDALKKGSKRRVTAATAMNDTSSRSHAVFTIFVKQEQMVAVEVANGEPDQPHELQTVSAKFNFVDLAGSESLKRTKATGDRAKEGISINCGLLALGNVISALCGTADRHIPYRDSKLTRLLQDSLGGNSRTLMIACASPSDIDFVETINTLEYANRAKRIKNKVVANLDRSGKLIVQLHQRIQDLEMELRGVRAELHRVRAELAEYKKLVPEGQAAAFVQPMEEDEEADALAIDTEEEGHEEEDECHSEDDALSGDDDEHEEERDRICNDLADLQEQITAKEQLFLELDQREKDLAQQRRNYEARLSEMEGRIEAVEAERDQAVKHLQAQSKSKAVEEKIRKVKEDYEQKIASLKNDQHKLRLMEKKHAKLQSKEKKHQEEQQRLMDELQKLKHGKVELMRRLKDENKRARDADKEHLQRLVKLERSAKKRENEIRLLKQEAANKTENLRRRNEEVRRLRQEKRVRSRGVSPAPPSQQRQLQQQQQQQQPQPQVQFSTPTGEKTTSKLVGKRALLEEMADTCIASPGRVKKQWDFMEKLLHRSITKRQTIAYMEEELHRLYEKRNRLHQDLKQMDELIQSNAGQPQLLKDGKKRIEDELESIQNQINSAQQAIMELQMVDKEEGVSTTDASLEELMGQIHNVMDAKYIIQHLMEMVVDKGAAIERPNADPRTSRLLHFYQELSAREDDLHASENKGA